MGEVFFVNATDGSNPQVFGENEYKEELGKVLDLYAGWSCTLSTEECHRNLDSVKDKLIRYVMDNDYLKFHDLVLSTAPAFHETEVQPFFSSLGAVIVYSPRTGTSLQLPVQDQQLPDKNQTVLVTDDGSKTTASIYGGRGLYADWLQAVLYIKSSDKSPSTSSTITVSGDEFRIFAGTITVSGSGKAVELTFPSLASFGLAREKFSGHIDLSVLLDKWRGRETESNYTIHVSSGVAKSEASKSETSKPEVSKPEASKLKVQEPRGSK